MRRKRVLGIFVALLVIVSSVMPFLTNVMAQPPLPKNVFGEVIPNSVTGVRAYDPVQNGVVAFYIQNRTNNGTHMDLMESSGATDYYLTPIHEGVSMWLVDDPGIVVVSVENGTTAGGDRAGYVAYANETLNMSNPQIFKDTELMKIPVPEFDINGTNFIQFTWTPLPDPWGLIAGYTVYRSTDNETWNLHQDVSVNNPVTGAMFNDTKVSPGTTYYYALKVVFVGYEYDNPANVANYECVYPGEGSTMMNSIFVDWDIDEIRITDGANGPDIVSTVYLNIGNSIQATASAYNNSFGFWGVIEVHWTQSTILGTLLPVDDTATTFTAGVVGGTTTIQAENTTLMLSDTFVIEIREPEVDYIELTDTPGGTPLDFMEVTVDEDLTIYASGYNNTGNTYIKLVEVNWTEDGGIGGFSATPGTMTIYTGTDPGLTNITGEAAPFIDTFLMRVYGVPKEVDYIEITDAPNGTILDNVNMSAGGQITLYASGYNDTTGYYGLVVVDWTIVTGVSLGELNNISGKSTTFTAYSVDGLVEIEGTNYYVPTITDTLALTILPPTVDYILIRDAPGGGGLDLTDPANYPSYWVGNSTVLYGAAYNDTSGFVRAVFDTSTWGSDGESIVTVTSPGIQTTITCSNTTSGTITLTLTEGTFTATTDITVLPPTPDSIEIRDAATGGNVVNTMTYVIQQTDTFYAIGHNVTAGNIGLVSVDWSSDEPANGTVTSPGTSTTFTAQNVTADGICTITATYMGMVSDTTGLITVKGATIDYIQIEDAAGGNANEITIDSFDLAGTTTRTYYCAGYNNTGVWVDDVDASWSVANIGNVNPTSGNLVQFTATAAGTQDLTATYNTLTATVSITVTGGDTTAPATPTGFTVDTISGQAALKITWDANAESDLDEYKIYRSTTSDSGFTLVATISAGTEEYTDSGLTEGTTYYYYITAVDTSDNESPASATMQQTVPAIGEGEEEEEGFPVVILLIIIIIIIVLLLLFFLMKRKKPEGEPALPEEKAEPEEEVPPPEEEAPPEEEEAPPEEEEPSEAPEGEAEGPEGEEQAEERELPPPP